jgi:SAM-dependent methyltransferase
VVGIDLSADMVRETTAEMQSFGWQHAAMHQMDAEQLDFPDASFDWVLCGFALWFFPQPYRALTEFFRLLRPGGDIGITTWVEDCPFPHLCREVLRPYLPPASPAEQGSEEVPTFDTPMRLGAALRKAGHTESQIIVEEEDFVFPDEEAVWVRLWSGGFRGRLERLAAPVREEIKADLFQQLQHLKQPDGIRTLWRALFALGNKPQY